MACKTPNCTNEVPKPKHGLAKREYCTQCLQSQQTAFNNICTGIVQIVKAGRIHNNDDGINAGNNGNKTTGTGATCNTLGGTYNPVRVSKDHFASIKNRLNISLSGVSSVHFNHHNWSTIIIHVKPL
jgi:hypothetical protein